MSEQQEKTLVAMTVKQVSEVFDQLKHDGRSAAKVYLVVDRGFPSIGSRHMTGITGIRVGFDWENGKIILETDEPLSVADEKLRELRRKVEVTNSALYGVRSILNKPELSDETKLAMLKKQIALFEDRSKETTPA